MTESTFEALLTGQLREYAEAGVRPIDRYAIAEGTIETGRRRTFRWPRSLGRNRRPMVLVLVGLLVAALLGAMTLVGGRPAPEPVLPPLLASGFVVTGSMLVARESATAIQLRDGRVLVVGGVDSQHKLLRSAEVYDPVTGTFALTGQMERGRAGYTKMRLLPDGRVLVESGCCNGVGEVGSEVYDPTTGSFSLTPGPEAAAAELLRVGDKSLHIVPASGDGSSRHWDPSTAVWSTGNAPPSGTYAATQLADGRWLTLEVLRGANGPTMGAASVYDPTTGAFTPAGDPAARHPYPVALLADGRVLLVGDMVGNAMPPSAELFDPTTGTFEAVKVPGSDGSVVEAARLPDGRVLLTFDPGPNTPELFDPATGGFTVLDSPLEGRSYPTVVALTDGRILILGGASSANGEALASAELYGPTPVDGRP